MQTLNVKPQLSEQIKSALATRAEKVQPTKGAKTPISKPNVMVDHDDKEHTLAFTVDLNAVSMRGDQVNVSEFKTDPTSGKVTGGNVILAGYYDKLSGLGIGVLGGEKWNVRVNLTLTLVEPTTKA